MSGWSSPLSCGFALPHLLGSQHWRGAHLHGLSVAAAEGAGQEAGAAKRRVCEDSDDLFEFSVSAAIKTSAAQKGSAQSVGEKAAIRATAEKPLR